MSARTVAGLLWSVAFAALHTVACSGEDPKGADDTDLQASYTEPGSGGAIPAGNWVTTWSTTLVRGDSRLPPLLSGTLREIVHTSVAGARVRVRLSNAFGTTPLRIGAVHVARRKSGAKIERATDRSLTFAGRASVEIPAGGRVTSDDIAFDVPALTDLAVSLEVAQGTRDTTTHTAAFTTSFYSFTSSAGDESLEWAIPATERDFLEGVEVLAADPSFTVVTLGDSITDGFASSIDANHRWPDRFARLVATAAPAIGVANEGYNGNQVLEDEYGPAAVARFERDVLANTGATHVILLEGINDIGHGGATLSAVQDGMRRIIAKAHGAHLKIIGGTLPPYERAAYYRPAGNQIRLDLNAWIRTSKEFDGVIDFDAALRDPGASNRLLPAYDSGDHLHPSDAGYEAMGALAAATVFD